MAPISIPYQFQIFERNNPQITVYVALLALDTRRLESGRIDCAPWWTLSSWQGASDHRRRSYGGEAPDAGAGRSASQQELGRSNRTPGAMSDRDKRADGLGGDQPEADKAGEGEAVEMGPPLPIAPDDGEDER